MSSSSRSTVVLPSPELRKLCLACLHRIKLGKEGIIERAVTDERARLERSWFRRLFRLAVPDDATIRRTLLEEPAGQSLFSFGCTVDMYAWRSDQVARRLMRASELAESVNVSTDDLDWIGA